jgi:hypothetical protein
LNTLSNPGSSNDINNLSINYSSNNTQDGELSSLDTECPEFSILDNKSKKYLLN